MRCSVRLSALVLCILVPCSGMLVAAEEPKPEAAAPPATPAKPATYKVVAKPFRVEVAVDGIFVAERSAEVAVLPEAWAEFTVESAVDHGTRVKAGDVILSFDPEKIDEAIADLETGNRLAEIALRQARADLELAEAAYPMDVAAAERNADRVAKDLRRYLEKERAHSEKSAEFSLRSSRNYLEYAREELRQLEKMYEADDLTEETEEIVLKRQRDAVETAEFRLESSELNHEETIETTIPQTEISKKEGARRSELAIQKSRVTMPLQLEKQRIDYANSEKALEKSKEKLRNMRKDRQLMTVKAPFDGIVYYGRCVQGNWSDVSTAAGKLRKGGSVQPKDVVMTVVDPRPLRIAASVPENQLHNLKRGVRGHAVPTGYPSLRLPAAVAKLLQVPVGKGSFACELTVEAKDEAGAVLPGMTCKVTLVALNKKKALAVPPQALFEDEEEPGKHHVFVEAKEGAPQKREVKVGKRSGDRVEVLKGLKAGETILLEKPKEES